MGFIIVVAGRAFSDATGMRLRSQNMLNSAEEAGRVSAILKEDISQMGAKSWEEGSGDNFEMVEEVYNNPANKDYSSYTLNRNSTTNFDELTFKKLHYNTAGACDGVMEVKWFVNEDGVLYRKCDWSSATKCPSPSSGRDDNACPSQDVEVARNVSAFKFLPSKSLVSEPIFPANNDKKFSLVKNSGAGGAIALPNATGTRHTLKYFTQNNLTGTNNSPEYTNFYIAEHNQPGCWEHNFVSGAEYSIDFVLPCDNTACADPDNNVNPMTLFQPGKDYLSIGLRGTSGNRLPISGIPDFLFYPPYDKGGKKSWHFDFSVPNDLPACIGITAAFYGPAYGGYLEIEGFTLSRKTDNVYNFDHRENIPDYNPTDYPSKASVKAFELTLEIKKGKKEGEITISKTVIPVPNNGILPPGVI